MNNLTHIYIYIYIHNRFTYSVRDYTSCSNTSSMLFEHPPEHDDIDQYERIRKHPCAEQRAQRAVVCAVFRKNMLRVMEQDVLGIPK